MKGITHYTICTQQAQTLDYIDISVLSTPYFCVRISHPSPVGTGVRELTRGLATFPQRWIHEPSVVRDRNGNPQEDPLAVHCFCICSGSALLGDLLWVSRYRERDLLSVLLIYPRIFLRVFIAYRLLVGFLYV